MKRALLLVFLSNVVQIFTIPATDLTSSSLYNSLLRITKKDHNEVRDKRASVTCIQVNEPMKPPYKICNNEPTPPQVQAVSIVPTHALQPILPAVAIPVVPKVPLHSVQAVNQYGPVVHPYGLSIPDLQANVAFHHSYGAPLPALAVIQQRPQTIAVNTGYPAHIPAATASGYGVQPTLTTTGNSGYSVSSAHGPVGVSYNPAVQHSTFVPSYISPVISHYQPLIPQPNYGYPSSNIQGLSEYLSPTERHESHSVASQHNDGGLSLNAANRARGSNYVSPITPNILPTMPIPLPTHHGRAAENADDFARNALVDARNNECGILSNQLQYGINTASFPNGVISDCNIPLISSCAPSVSIGYVVHDPGNQYHVQPATYKEVEDNDVNTDTDQSSVKKTEATSGISKS